MQPLNVFLTLALTFTTGGPHEMTVTDEREAAIEKTFNALRADTMDVLDDFYAADVTFEDPLGRIEGLADLKAYYADMYEDVEEISFAFHEQVVEGNTHVALWTMRVHLKRLNRGREITVEGNSVIRFNAEDRVVYHRDYFDMGAMVYQHVPILKCFIKRINKRLAHDD